MKILDDNELFCQFSSMAPFPVFTDSFKRKIDELIDLSSLLSKPVFTLEEDDPEIIRMITIEIPREFYLDLRKYPEKEYNEFNKYVRSTDNILPILSPTKLEYQGYCVNSPWITAAFKKNKKYYLTIESDRILRSY